VAGTIGLGQINNALGITGVEKQAYFHENLYMSATNLHLFDVYEFVAFFAFCATLYYLSTNDYLNGGGRRPKPWLFIIAGVGIVFGVLFRHPFFVSLLGLN